MVLCVCIVGVVKAPSSESGLNTRLLASAGCFAGRGRPSPLAESLLAAYERKMLCKDPIADLSLSLLACYVVALVEAPLLNSIEK